MDLHKYQSESLYGAGTIGEETHRFYLRSHGHLTFDSVLYCI
jgi:hypothetical protein